MARSVISENMPPSEIKRIGFDDSLLDLEIAYELGEDTDRIDYFWTGLYYSQLPSIGLAYLSQPHIELQELLVTPQGVNLDTHAVDVMIEAMVYNYRTDEPEIAYPIYVTLQTDGTFLDTYSKDTLRYSKSMKWHVRELLGHAAINL